MPMRFVVMVVCWLFSFATLVGASSVSGSSPRSASSYRDVDFIESQSQSQSRRLAALGGSCTADSDCTGANQVRVNIICDWCFL